MIAAKLFRNLRIAKNDDVARRSFTLFRSGPILQITGPRETRKYLLVLTRFMGYDKFKRLQIRRRGGKARKFNEAFELFFMNRFTLIEPPVASIFRDNPESY